MAGKTNRRQASKAEKNTHNILHELSLATHFYVRQKTHSLTRLKDTPESESNVEILSQVEGIEEADDQWRPNPWTKLYEGRVYKSSDSGYRGVSPHAKDFARIIHSPSFRRLQGKSQLIPSGENEFFRTRLTHSLEVAEIATRIARKINSMPGYFNQKSYPLNIDLVGCAALLHDIGHPPFGHSGEEALNEMMCGLGGFEGNAQTLRIVSRLENRLGRIEECDSRDAIRSAIDEPRGLNLTFGTLAGILKYPFLSTGPTDINNIKLHKGYYREEEGLVNRLRAELGISAEERLRTIECQIMDIADDIAYSAYDLEDTLEAGIVTPLDLMSIDDDTLDKIRKRVLDSVSGLGALVNVTNEAILESLSDAFGTLVEIGDETYDLKGHRRHRLAFVGRTYLESIEHAKNPLVRRQYLETLIESSVDAIDYDLNENCPSLSKIKIDPKFLFRIECMKAFNFHKVITSRRLKMYHHRSKEIVSDLFGIFIKDKDGDLFSDGLRRARQSMGGDNFGVARLVADHISSLTDMEAVRLHDQLKSSRNAPFTAYWR